MRTGQGLGHLARLQVVQTDRAALGRLVVLLLLFFELEARNCIDDVLYLLGRRQGHPVFVEFRPFAVVLAGVLGLLLGRILVEVVLLKWELLTLLPGLLEHVSVEVYLDSRVLLGQVRQDLVYVAHDTLDVQEVSLAATRHLALSEARQATAHHVGHVGVGHSLVDVGVSKLLLGVLRLSGVTLPVLPARLGLRLLLHARPLRALLVVLAVGRSCVGVQLPVHFVEVRREIFVEFVLSDEPRLLLVAVAVVLGLLVEPGSLTLHAGVVGLVDL